MAILRASGNVAAAFYSLPADRSTLWQPGVTYNGGIPVRTAVYTTIASTGDSTDRLAEIQAALNACPADQVVQLGAGQFYVSGYARIPSDNVILRGTRVSSSLYTELVKIDGSSFPPGDRQGSSPGSAVVVGKSNSFSLVNGFSASSNLTSDGAKGAYTVTVASATGFSVGDLVRVDELSLAGWRDSPRDPGVQQVWASSDWRVVYACENPSYGLGDFSDGNIPAYYDAYQCPDRPTCEMKKIVAINGNNITFETPLHIGYRTANTARVARYDGDVITGAGIENISATGFDLGTFSFNLADGCWMSGCEATAWFDKPFRFVAAYRCEVRKSIHHNTVFPGYNAENYGHIFDWASADCLIEDSIGFGCDKVVAARAAGAGCVVAYNYLDAGFSGYLSDGDNCGWVEVGMNASHFVGCHHTLFEGNWAFNADSDYTHGASGYMTHFRNHLTGFRNRFINVFENKYYDDVLGNEAGATGGATNFPQRCAATNTYGYWMSFIGNVLGMSGLMSGWNLENVNLSGGQNAIYKPGWAPTASNTDPDPQVLDSGFAGAIIRDGNYDYLTNSQLWHGLGGNASSGDTTPPSVSAFQDSLYLSSKPDFMGSNTWPWVDPVNGATYTLPAKARYDAGDYFDANIAFPVSASGDSRYLIDANDKPILIKADAGWSAFAQLTLAEWQTYIDTRVSQGFNAVLVNIIEAFFADTPPQNINGDEPFSPSNSFANPNTAYWTLIDSMVQYAYSKGVLLLTCFAYLGYDDSQGWGNELAADSNTDLQTYGAFLGNRYAAYPNLIWLAGGDRLNQTAAHIADHNSIIAGIEGSSYPGTVLGNHPGPEEQARDYEGNYSSLNFNGVYTYSETAVYSEANSSYSATPMLPGIWMEGEYENENGADGYQATVQAWQAVLSGCTAGYIVGTHRVWCFMAANAAGFYDGAGNRSDLDWTDDLSTVQGIGGGMAGQILEQVSWYLFAPDTTGTVVTSALGSGLNRICCAKASDSSSALAIVPTATSPTLDCSEFSGSNVNVSWIDPYTGAETVDGTYSTSGTQSITHPGNNSEGNSEWILKAVAI